ncbi:MAG: DUF4136 domain-containing protein [Candidatus Acidiferrales bacterium]
MSQKTRLRLTGLALLAIVFAVATAPAHAQDVRTNYLPGTDFSKFKTYRWGAIEGGGHPNQITDAEIKSAVDAQMAAKGFTKTDSESADLVLAYQTAVDHEKQWNSFGTGRGLRWGGMATATSTPIAVGTIALDMYDPTARTLVWQGQATKTIDSSANQEKQQKNINNAMKKLLKNFPPKAK